MNTTVIKRRLYLADLEVTAKDVYIKQDFANKTAEILNTNGQPQMRHNLYKTNLDTNKDTSMLDFSSTNFSQNVLQKQNQDIVANASEFLVSTGNSGKIPLEAETIKLISLWSANDPKKMEKMIGIIFNAKKASETFITQQTGTPTTIFLDNYEDLQHDITVSLRRTFNAIRNKQDKKQKVNPENYISGAMRNTFEVWYSEYMQSLSSNG
ncbi:plasmid replication initiation protein [Weissella paramesenteroides]|uniref:plasmid replication initiation protein n=1 Tax=Weissella paramesenteroides TaxID=1249 RepID=UPI00223BFB4D|nr:plasmid replication initiation protein [Weissella paramesenteroides]MCS9983753.1 plasmid replication initiation protein [Weissella paramesenteroides]MCS9997887.1 plasmid replication initiation protein [Weissella paramesenteroides]MCT0260105.1 plasmid replication initiation protein [Weissella paramesenteroides]